MNTKTIFSLFAFLSLVILSLGFVNAQSQDPCLSISNIVVPTTVQNTQTSFTATFDINFAGGNCVDRTINNISLESMFSGSSTVVGSWQVTSPSTPVTINSTSNNPTSVSVTYTLPTTGTGTLGTTLSIGSTPTVSGTPNYLSVFPFNIQITAPTSVLSINVGQDSTITLTNSGTTTLTNIILSEISNFGVIFNPTNIASLAAGQTSSVISVLVNSLSTFDFGFNTLIVKAQSGTVETTANIQVIKTFCSQGPAGNDLELKKVKIDNLDGKDDEWDIFDEIEITVEVENNGNEDIDDVFVELGFFSEGNEYADDFDWISSDETEVDLGRIKDGKDDKATFKFRIPVEFAERGDEAYMLAVKAYSDDLGEANECVDSDSQELSDDFFEAIDVKVEEDPERFVVVHDIRMEDQYTCGDTVSGQFTVANIGEDNQERVKTRMFNTELGIDQDFEITSDLDVGEDKLTSFSFTIPQGISSGTKTLSFRTEYDYDNGDYDEISEETFKGFFEVLGCSPSNVVNLGTGPSSNAIITARLVSDAIPGKNLVVEATITNTGTDTSTYTVGVTGFSSWASLESISENSLTIESGKSKTVTLTLNVKETASGSEKFNIQTTSSGMVETQEVEVNFSDSSSGFNFNFEDNLIWIIAVVNVVLILLIIFVAIRLSRR